MVWFRSHIIQGRGRAGQLHRRRKNIGDQGIHRTKLYIGRNSSPRCKNGGIME